MLIPEVKSPTIVAQFLPISLCCTFYKIITPVLLNWLKGVIGNLVSLEQQALISDNILLSQELGHSLEKSSDEDSLVLGFSPSPVITSYLQMIASLLPVPTQRSAGD